MTTASSRDDPAFQRIGARRQAIKRQRRNLPGKASGCLDRASEIADQHGFAGREFRFRHALGPNAPKEDYADEVELPDAYGTKEVLLAARDPHWLYAHWDLTRDQLRRYNAMARDGHLALRVFLGAATGEPVSEVPVHPESRHWFAHVEQAGQPCR